MFQFYFSSTGRGADRYPESASLNPAQVNIFQLTLAVPDYHENFLFRDDLVYANSEES